MHPRWALALLSAIFVALASWYASATPYRQAGVLWTQRGPDGQPARVQDVGAPDERQHANYVRRLLDGGGIPVLAPGATDLYETYQSHQPPAYYVLAAAWCKITGADPSAAGDGFKLRALNVILGVITLVGIYFCGAWGLRDGDAGLAGAALVCLMPMFLALHGAASNDPLLFATLTWCLALAGRWIQSRDEGWVIPVSIGVLCGLGALTKTTALAMLPTLALAGLLAAKAKRPRAITHVATMLALGVVIAAPWWIRNMSLYGDPLAMGAFNQAFTGSPQAAMFISELGAYTYWTQWVGWWTLRSFIGVFGYMDIFMPSSLYGALWIGLAALLVGASRRQTGPEHPASDRAFAWMCGALLLVVFSLFVQFNRTYFQAQARYLYPSCAAAAMAFGCGATAWAGRWRAWAWLAAAILMVALNLYALDLVRDVFARSVAS